MQMTVEAHRDLYIHTSLGKKMRMTKHMSAVAFATSALLTLAPMAANAAVGDQVYAGGGSISIQFEGSDAGYNSTLELWINGLAVTPAIFPNHSTPIGTTYNVPGSFSAGTLLDIRLYVVDTGDTWHTGPGANNSDGIAHANVIYNYMGQNVRTYVGFEDLAGGGDGDYNDHTFSFTNTVNAVPEPETYAMLLAGLGLLGAVARRRSAK